MTATPPPSAYLEHHRATDVDEHAARARWDALSPHQRAAAVRRRQARLAGRGDPRSSRAQVVFLACLLVIVAAMSAVVVTVARSGASPLWAAWLGLVGVAAAVFAFVIFAGVMGDRLDEQLADQALPQTIPPIDETCLAYRGPEAGWQPAARHLQVRTPDAATTTTSPTTKEQR